MASAILKLPNRAGKILTWAFTVFFAVNIIMTGLSLYRWSERVDGQPASNGVEQILDARFPDERMQRIFPNMVFGDDYAAGYPRN